MVVHGIGVDGGVGSYWDDGMDVVKSSNILERREKAGRTGYS
jgi:hypothetical protein